MAGRILIRWPAGTRSRAPVVMGIGMALLEPRRTIRTGAPINSNLPIT